MKCVGSHVRYSLHAAVASVQVQNRVNSSSSADQIIVDIWFASWSTDASQDVRVGSDVLHDRGGSSFSFRASTSSRGRRR